MGDVEKRRRIRYESGEASELMAACIATSAGSPNTSVGWQFRGWHWTGETPSPKAVNERRPMRLRSKIFMDLRRVESPGWVPGRRF